MLNTRATVVDCRGQSCPGPILATAKAARAVRGRGGGLLEVSADDDAFPLDIRSWCRSTDAELVELKSEAGTHKALVRVETPQTRPRATPGPAPVTAHEELDCRGLQCPKPILEIARKARAMQGGTLEVLADDPAFAMDVQSWCRSSGSTIEWSVEEGDASRVRIRLGASRTAGGAKPSRVGSTEPAKSAPLASPGNGALEISIVGVPTELRVAHLEALTVTVSPGSLVRIICDDPGFSGPLVSWATGAGHRLIGLDARGTLTMDLEVHAQPKVTALAEVDPGVLVASDEHNACTLLVLHNDKEALLAALLVAVGAAAQGMSVMMFFTFWGLNLLRGDTPNPEAPAQRVSWMQRLMKWMMPKGPRRQRLGQMDMAGIGRGVLTSIMRKHQLMDVPELMDSAVEEGVRFVACTMSMQVMGITQQDLAPRPNLELGGVATFVDSAAKSRISLTF